MLERLTRPVNQGCLRILGRCVLATSIGLAAAGCDEGDRIFGGRQVPDLPEYTMSVDCKTDPNSRAVQRVVQIPKVQIVMLSVIGEGYQDKWRLQVFPPDSDLTVSRLDGGEPRYPIRASDLETGNPQHVALTHGGVVLREVSLAEGQPVPPQSPEASAGPPIGSQLEITLACAPSR